MLNPIMVYGSKCRSATNKDRASSDPAVLRPGRSNTAGLPDYQTQTARRADEELVNPRR